MKRKRNILWYVTGILILALIVALINRDALLEHFRVMNYTPSEEMGRILGDLSLTDKGEYIFKASQPILSGRGEFNAHCRTDLSVEAAVLGCYADGDIFVYDIESKELDGIRELTTAHELLHAVWARMNESERRALAEDLDRVLEDNREILGAEIAEYETGEKQEELYVRAGTEVAKLSDKLEKHYAEIFKDQDKIVGFYNKYIAVFRKLESEMEELAKQMESLKASIETKTPEYKQQAEQLNKEITEFNECAETAGCFNSQWAFYTRRNELMQAQDALQNMYTEINGMVEQYNVLVEKYNADVLYNDKLNDMINSAVEPVEIEE